MEEGLTCTGSDGVVTVGVLAGGMVDRDICFRDCSLHTMSGMVYRDEVEQRLHKHFDGIKAGLC